MENMSHSRRAYIEAINGLENVSIETLDNLLTYERYDSIFEKDKEEFYRLLSKEISELTIKHPDWGLVSGRLLIKALKIQAPKTFSEFMEICRNRFNQDYYNFVMENKDELNNMIVGERDNNFAGFGVSTLIKSYLSYVKDKKSKKEVRVETPQYLFLRTAIQTWMPDLEKIKEMYDDLSQGKYSHASPTLMNSCFRRNNLASCFLMKIGDDMRAIAKGWHDSAIISMNCGGLGIYYGDLRHSEIGEIGMSTGLVPWLKIKNQILNSVDQGGKRKGSATIQIGTWHIDVFEFLDLRKNTGSEAMRARDLFYALLIDDVFMERVMEDKEYSLFCPHKAPGLSETHGDEFRKLYEKYEKEFEQNHKGELYYRRVRARDLYFQIKISQIKTGMPFTVYKDALNEKCNQKNLGMIITNLCTEITEHVSEKETASCLTGDTLVLTKNGYKRIDSIKENDEIYTHFDSDKRLNEKPSYQKAKLLNQGIKQVYEIKTIGGRTIKATKDHRFLVVNKNSHNTKKTFEWKRTDELTLNDKIYSPRLECLDKYNNINTEKDIDIDWLTAGWLLGDGWQREKCYGVCFGPTETQAQKIVLDRMKTWSGMIDKNKHDTQGISNEYTQKNGVVSWSSKRREFIKYIQETFHMFPHKGPEKILPEIVLNNDADKLASFLSGLFSADGTVVGFNSKLQVSLSSASEKLLADVQSALQQFGIYGSYHMTYLKSRKRWQGNLAIFGVKNLTLYREKIGFKLCPIKEEKLKDRLNEKKVKFSQKGKDFFKIKSIEKLGEEQVWDISLPSHNFVANGYIVHNCNLAAICLNSCVKNNGKNAYFDFDELDIITRKLVRNLNNIIDRNYYPDDIPEIKYANLKNRPLGIGVQGFADCLALLDIPFVETTSSEYDSNDSFKNVKLNWKAKSLNNEIFETMYYAAVSESINIAKENGKPYDSYEGSPASQGLLQFDLWNNEGKHTPFNHEYRHSKEQWDALKVELKKYGMYNSLLIALMPTASTAQILGNNEAFEPYTENIYARTVLSGQFIIVNRHLVRDFTELGLWNTEIIQSIIHKNGSIQHIQAPSTFNEKQMKRFLFLKDKYRTVYEIPQKALMEMSLDRGRFVCQTQSFNCFMKDPTPDKLLSYDYYGWSHGIKTGMYYLRSGSANEAIKFSAQTEKKKTSKFKKANMICNDDVCMSCIV